ncbi:Hypothetical protein NTJ_01965 [Nesidiocoris tenuis]|uniref:CCHC-type domain-containing protein n=1 Tax=Nesidiocoris tenuis TaxID=355587 RepID=A0ABN7AA29_9HEMI|nr:Hypothetical protein NTJ_01965 [Nesidiocoris tenuis]
MEENEHWPVPTPEGPRQPGNPTKEGLVVSEEPNLNLLGVNLLLKAAEAADAATVTMGDHNYTSQEKTCITLQSQDLGYPASDTRLPTVRQNGIIFKERRYLPAHGKPFILVLDKKMSEKVSETGIGALLNRVLPQNRFSVVKTGRERFVLTVESYDAYNKIRASKEIQKTFLVSSPSSETEYVGVIRVGSENVLDTLLNDPNDGINSAFYLCRFDKGQTTKTNWIRIHFEGPEPRANVKIGHQNYQVDKYIQKIKICKNCHRYGHLAMSCKAQSRCPKCGSTEPQTHCCDVKETHCLMCLKKDHLVGQKICPLLKHLAPYGNRIAQREVGIQMLIDEWRWCNSKFQSRFNPANVPVFPRAVYQSHRSPTPPRSTCGKRIDNTIQHNLTRNNGSPAPNVTQQRNFPPASRALQGTPSDPYHSPETDNGRQSEPGQSANFQSYSQVTKLRGQGKNHTPQNELNFYSSKRRGQNPRPTLTENRGKNSADPTSAKFENHPQVRNESDQNDESLPIVDQDPRFTKHIKGTDLTKEDMNTNKNIERVILKRINEAILQFTNSILDNILPTLPDKNIINNINSQIEQALRASTRILTKYGELNG